MRAIPLAVVGVCLLAAVAHAQQPSPEFTKEYNAGVDAAKLGKNAEARQHLEAAKAIDPTLPGPWRWLGAVAAAENDWAGCVENTRKAMSLNLKSTTIQDTRTVHDDCRQQWGKPAFTGTYNPNEGAISVTTDQVGAAVEINDLSYGSTPILKTLAAGTVTVTVTKTGYLPGTRTVEILPAIVTDVDFVLEVDPGVIGIGGGNEITNGWVKIVSSVADLVVEIDGKPGEVDEQGRYVVEAGPHQVTITAPGKEPYTKNVRVTKGQLVSVEAKLRDQGSVDQSRKRGRMLVTAGTGLALVGAVFGMLSIQATDRARDEWTIEVNRPSFSAVPEDESDAIAPIHTRGHIEKLVDRGKTLGVVSTVTFVAAAATIGVGAYFLVKAKSAGDVAEVKAAMIPIEGGAAAMAEVRW